MPCSNLDAAERSLLSRLASTGRPKSSYDLLPTSLVATFLLWVRGLPSTERHCRAYTSHEAGQDSEFAIMINPAITPHRHRTGQSPSNSRGISLQDCCTTDTIVCMNSAAYWTKVQLTCDHVEL